MSFFISHSDRPRRSLYTFFAVLLVLLGACSGERVPVTAITNVTVIDAAGGVREGQTVVFTAAGITAVQPASEPLEGEQPSKTIDGSGKYLIPGLWDFHVHLTYDERLTQAMPALFLQWGVTSVRDTGGLMHKILPVVEEMRAAGARAPRVFFAGPLLDGEYVVYDGVDRPHIGISLPDPAAARRTVAELSAQGVDFVKAYEMLSPETFAALVEAAAEAGLPVDSHVPLSMRARIAGPMVQSIEHLRNIEMDCARDAAGLHAERIERLGNPDRLSGFRLRASLHALQRLPALRAYRPEECETVIAALAAAGTVMVPTLRLNSYSLLRSHEREDWRAALQALPAEVRADWLQQAAQWAAEREQAESSDNPTEWRGMDGLFGFAGWSLFLTARMHGVADTRSPTLPGSAVDIRPVPVGAGTDTPINLAVPGYSLHEELEMLVLAGLSPMQALEAATLVPARWFGLEGRLGAVAAGQEADLVLLDADPLADISNTKRIALVVSKGAVVVR